MDRRVFAVIVLVVSCDRQVEDGVFAPTGTPMSPTTVASGGDGDESRDTSEGTAADDGGATTQGGGTDPTFGDPESSGADPSDADPTNADPSDADPTNADPSDGDPTDAGSTGVDPTGVDPTGADPTGAASNCCDVQLVGGCDDPAIEACVCGLDAFCCDIEWDDVCVGEAVDCGAACDGGGGGGGGDCCVAALGPGCADAAVEACVCGLDPFCCDTAWDDTCVSEAVVDCFAAC